MNRSLVARVLAVTVFVLTAAACGGDEDGQGSPVPADSSPTQTASETSSGSVEVEQYLEGLCTAVSDYQDELASLNTDLQGELGGATPSAEDVKDLLVTFLDEAVAATQGLAEEVRALGTPDVEGGDEIAVTFVSAFEQVEDLFARSADDVEALSTDDPQALAEGLQAVASDLQEGGQEIAGAFEDLPQDQIDVDPEDIPACAGIA